MLISKSSKNQYALLMMMTHRWQFSLVIYFKRDKVGGFYFWGLLFIVSGRILVLGNYEYSNSTNTHVYLFRLFHRWALSGKKLKWFVLFPIHGTCSVRHQHLMSRISIFWSFCRMVQVSDPCRKVEETRCETNWFILTGIAVLPYPI